MYHVESSRSNQLIKTLMICILIESHNRGTLENENSGRSTATDRRSLHFEKDADMFREDHSLEDFVPSNRRLSHVSTRVYRTEPAKMQAYISPFWRSSRPYCLRLTPRGVEIRDARGGGAGRND